jgi:hypothetical protein
VAILILRSQLLLKIVSLCINRFVAHWQSGAHNAYARRTLDSRVAFVGDLFLFWFPLSLFGNST